MINKLLPLLAVGFPGAYKLFAVLVIGFYHEEAIANQFSEAFFWVSFLVSFSGIPLASIVMSKESYLTRKQVFTWSLATVLFAFSISYLYELKDKELLINAAIIFSAVLMSLYEVFKTRAFNVAAFSSILVCSVATIFSFIFLFLIPNSSELLTLIFFGALFVPIFIEDNKHSYESTGIELNHKGILKNYCNYAGSNILSTSIMYLIPIILLQELGNEIAMELAQVFTISTLIFLVPRAMLAKKLPYLRNNEDVPDHVRSFLFSILGVIFLAIVTIVLLAFFTTNLYFEIYSLLFFGILLSQLSLPYSSVLVVNGNSKLTLKINIYSFIFLALMSGVLFMVLDKGSNRAEALLYSYIVFQLCKFVLNYLKTKPLINSGNKSVLYDHS